MTVERFKYRNTIKTKSQIVLDYNTGKSSIDLADQMASYSNPLRRRSLKWYRKLAMNLLLNISVVNASVLFKKVTGPKISITEFRAALVERFIIKEVLHPDNNPGFEHTLEKASRRSRYFKCYKQNVQRKKKKHSSIDY